MTKISNSPLFAAIVTSFVATILCGCQARQMGVAFSDTQSRTVDNSWITVTQSCWPDVAHQGFTTAGMKRYLADPTHFRAAFATYSGLSDAQLIVIVSKPVSAAPSPDTSVLTHSQTPILTRDQALARTPAEQSPVSSTNGSAPMDALCSVQSGTPIGFK